MYGNLSFLITNLQRLIQVSRKNCIPRKTWYYGENYTLLMLVLFINTQYKNNHHLNMFKIWYFLHYKLIFQAMVLVLLKISICYTLAQHGKMHMGMLYKSIANPYFVWLYLYIFILDEFGASYFFLSTTGYG